MKTKMLTNLGQAAVLATMGAIESGHIEQIDTSANTVGHARATKKNAVGC